MDGLFLELGPLRLVPGGGGRGNTDTLKINPNSWHNVGTLVFIDQPIG
jgi:carboxypeptidase C (cathepsin A)